MIRRSRSRSSSSSDLRSSYSSGSMACDVTETSCFSDESDCSTDLNPLRSLPAHHQLESIESAPGYLSDDDSSLSDTFCVDDSVATRWRHRPCDTRKHLPTFSCLFVAIVVAAFYCIGSNSQEENTRVSRRLELAENSWRKLERNQERLLVQLTKNHLPERPSSLAGTDDLGHELIERVEALQNDLEKKTKLLVSERRKRRSAERFAVDSSTRLEDVVSEASKSSSRLQADIGRLHRTLAVQKFGIGPHFAEFQVRIWNGERSETGSFTIQFASLEFMPATVFMLMQQIDLRMWDNTMFSINGPHVLVAQPISATARPGEEHAALIKMEASGLARLPFAEYSHHVPHKTYTLGLGGGTTPGPNFYINKIDNSEHHAGQPCFGSIIIGHETVDKMGALTGPVGDPFYIQPIEILKVRLVRNLEEVQGGMQYMASLFHRDEH